MKLETLIKSLQYFQEKYGPSMEVALDFAADGKFYQGAICTVAVPNDAAIRIVSFHTYRSPKKDHFAIKAQNKEDIDMCLVPSHKAPKITIVKP